MYAHFYHLSENPFNLTPDPKFHYINESTREALAAVLYGIKSRKGFLTLIGEAGTGKTTLLRRIVDEIEGETRVVFVFNPGVSFDELLEYLCMELGIRAEGGGRLQLIEKLNQFLLQQLTEGRNVVVIIDEAQTLDDGVLEELRMLSNLETSKEKILQIVLSGQPELEEKLRRPNLRQLRQRIGVRATLKPMRADEIRAYVETRLRSAGGQKAELFTASALLRCWKASQGIPRVINVICDNAMMIAFAEGSDRITASVMNAAIRDLDGIGGSQPWWSDLREYLALPAVRYGGVAAAVLVAAFALGRSFQDQVDFKPPPVAPAVPGPAAVPSSAGSPGTAAVAVPAAPAPVAPPLATSAPVAPPPATSAPVASPSPPPVQTAPAPVVPSPGSATESPAAAPAGLAPAVGSLASAPTGEGASAVRVPVAPPPAASPSADPAFADTVAGSLRRAEEKARSTAARLYGGTVEPVAPLDGEPRPEDARLAAELAAERESLAREQARRAREEQEDLRRAEQQAAIEAAEDARARQAAAASRLASEAPPSVAEPPSGLADGLESVASLSGNSVKPVKAAEKPVVGRHIRVTRGDTVWAIAMQYYGSVDSSVLTEIFRHNPGIRNAHQLPVGSDVFVPFLKPEHMVDPVQGGGYRVLVAESAEPAEIAEASSWAAAKLPGRELRTSAKGKDNPVRAVYATGFTGREAALTAARQLLDSETP